MTKNQYKKTGSDESYTYPYLITPLLSFIEEFKDKIGKENLTIWCPFDLEKDLEIKGVKYFESYYCKIFKEAGYNVICSHILTGQDFFEYEPLDYDIIVSNPPFKNKRLFFERALSLHKPFVLLSTASWFNDGGVYNVFKNEKLQLLMPKERAVFFDNSKNQIGKRASFKSIYYCKDFLVGHDIKWFELGKQKGV